MKLLYLLFKLKVKLEQKDPVNLCKFFIIFVKLFLNRIFRGLG
jgi:hypothetical protein